MDQDLPRIELNRDDLHRRVWAAPLPIVAAELQLATDTLKRICGLLEVPLPKSGHWRRAKRPRTKSPQRRKRDESQSLWIRQKGDKWVIEPSASISTAAARGKVVKLDEPHALVRRDVSIP